MSHFSFKRPYLETVRDWIGLCMVLRPREHGIGYMGDGVYRSKDPTNSIKVLKEHINSTQITQKYNMHTCKHKTANPLVYTNMG